MFEMPLSKEDHGHIAGVGGNYRLIPHGTSRLNRGGRILAAVSRPSAKGKKASEQTNEPASGRPPPLPNRNLRTINARHLPRPDSKGALATYLYVGVGFHMFHDVPTKNHRPHFLIAGLALRDYFPVTRAIRHAVTIL